MAPVKTASTIANPVRFISAHLPYGNGCIKFALYYEHCWWASIVGRRLYLRRCPLPPFTGAVPRKRG